MNPLFKQYADLQGQISTLEDMKEMLRAEIMVAMDKEVVDKAITEYGSFTIANKTTYTYSSKIKTLEDKVKVAKAKEVNDGTAAVKISNYLLFKGIKSE